MSQHPPDGPESTADESNPVVCSCKLVSRNEIIDAIKAGHSTFIGLRLKLSVTTGCGSCLIEVDRLLAEYKDQTQDDETSF